MIATPSAVSLPAIALIVDRRPIESESPAHLRRDLEMTDAVTLDHLTTAIERLGLPYQIYESPVAFARDADRHRDDLIWSIYGGSHSRNRLALVPAICEAYGIKYVGPDVYGHIMCHDKDVAKRLAQSYKLKTPRWRIARTHDEVKRKRFPWTPLVVKPLLEGSSIGISQRNLVHTEEAAKDLAIELIANMSQPIVIEEFIGGREVTYNWISAEGHPEWTFTEIAVLDDSRYFSTHLFDADEKMNRRLHRTVLSIESDLDLSDKSRIDAFIRAVGTLAYCRIDGKLLDGEFYFIEATPDAHLGPKASFAAGFLNKGWQYEDVIGAIIRGAIRYPRAQLTNDQGTSHGSPP
jgi:D-alanine-D-alanine ligase